MRAARRPPPADSARPRRVAGSAGRARHLQDDRAPSEPIRSAPTSSPWRPTRRTCSPSNCCSAKPASRVRCASCRSFETADDLRNAGIDAATAAVGAVVSRAHSRASGSDDRLLRLREGRRPLQRGVGAVSGAGGDCRGVPRKRRARHVVPRPRRQRGPRRRADLPRHPVAAAGIGRRHDPRHRTGRDDPGEVRAAKTSPCARSRSTRPRRSTPR